MKTKGNLGIVKDSKIRFGWFGIYSKGYNGHLLHFFGFPNITLVGDSLIMRDGMGWRRKYGYRGRVELEIIEA